MIQTNVSQMGEPNCAAMVAGFINMPEPMILPTTIEVADQKPICFCSEFGVFIDQLITGENAPVIDENDGYLFPV